MRCGGGEDALPAGAVSDQLIPAVEQQRPLALAGQGRERDIRSRVAVNFRKPVQVDVLHHVDVVHQHRSFIAGRSGHSLYASTGVEQLGFLRQVELYIIRLWPAA